RPNAPRPVAKSGSAVGSGVSKTGVKARFKLPDGIDMGSFDKPGPVITDKRKEQQVTPPVPLARLPRKFWKPNASKLANWTFPPKTIKVLTFGLPIYSPRPNPAGLLVTCTLVAADNTLSTRPLTVPSTRSKLGTLLNEKWNVRALAE